MKENYVIKFLIRDTDSLKTLGYQVQNLVKMAFEYIRESDVLSLAGDGKIKDFSAKNEVLLCTASFPWDPSIIDMTKDAFEALVMEQGNADREISKVKRCVVLEVGDMLAQVEDIEVDREAIAELAEYCRKTPKKVLALFGLRRTGKSVLMMRQALSLIEAGKTVSYIMVSEGATLDMLFDTICDVLSKDIRYIFIDEITFVEGFAQQADWVYNHIVLKSRHCIVAGMDSFGLILAASHAWFDRVSFIGTTHIPFSEYKKLRKGNTLSNYLRTGGIFGIVDPENYTDTSIIGNIINSVNRCEEQGYYNV